MSNTPKTLEARVLRVLKAQRKNPIALRDLAKKAGVPKHDRDALRLILDGLKADNKLVDRGGKVILAENLGLVGGKIVKVTGTFGFAKPDREGDRDIFVPGRKLAGAMPGDRVLLKVSAGSGQLPEGEVYKVTQESHQTFLGVLEVLPDGVARVHPDKYVRFPIRLAPKGLGGAKDGDKVLCEISRRGESHRDLRARVITTFSLVDSAAASSEAILQQAGIVREFPSDAEEQAAALAARKALPQKELEGRLDLRDKRIFTMDGADSKDLDDAISLERRVGGGWELGVHIADVSYYVGQDTPLDKEAYRRGTSVYFADSVIPMLPPALSNGICSLNPGEDRLAFSALIDLDVAGKITGFRFVKTVIRSQIKGIYSEVNAVLGGTAEGPVLQKYTGVLDMLWDMKKLAGQLAQRRRERGSVNLETVESRLILDAQGRCVGVAPRERGLGEGIIEEFMLAANQAAATFALEQKLPFLFRVHDNPDPDRINQLWDILEQLGVPVQRPRAGVTSGQLAQVLDKVRGTPVEPVVNTMVLRSMAKAQYSEGCTGHFGLALHNYTHFTSPIRRYPDLAIHRILSGLVTGMNKEMIHRQYDSFVVEAAHHASQREVAAMAAERDCEDCYKAEYMAGQLGREMEGWITSVTGFGLYVQLANTVEGLVPLSAFPEGDWQSDGVLAVTERNTGKKLQLGDRVRVLVAGADVSTGKIDFAMK